MTLMICFFTFNSFAKEAAKPEKKDDVVCIKSVDLKKMMEDNKYSILLNMTGKDNVVQSIWIIGQAAVITATFPDSGITCMLSTMTSVVYNPNTIEEIWEEYKKQMKQKDI